MVHKDKNKYNTCKHNNAVNNFNTAKNQCQYTLVFWILLSTLISKRSNITGLKIDHYKEVRLNLTNSWYFY